MTEKQDETTAPEIAPTTYEQELEAMAVVANAFNALDKGAQTRIIVWAMDRYRLGGMYP